MDLIISKHFNAPDLEFQWDPGIAGRSAGAGADPSDIRAGEDPRPLDEVRAGWARPMTAEQRAELTPQPPPCRRPQASNRRTNPCKGGSGKAKTLFAALTGAPVS